MVLTILCAMSLLSFKRAEPFHERVESYFLNHLNELKILTDSMLINNQINNVAHVQRKFYECRELYKKIEPIVEYYFTENAVKLNGPNLLEAEPSMPGEFKYPTGFQVLEEALFSDEVDNHVVRNEIQNIQFSIKNIKAFASDVIYTPTTILDALKLNFFRLMTKGITGFDSPIILNSVNEAQASLLGTVSLLELFDEDWSDFKPKIDSAVSFLNNVKDFNSWDRATFITKYMNPLTRAFVTIQKMHQVPFDTIMPKLIHPNAMTLFDYSKWDIFFFAPFDALPVTTENINIGSLLFFDNRLSTTLKHNCSSCHDPNKDFTDGQITSASITDGQSLLRNTPTLFNVGYQPAQFYDKRVVYLEDQIHDVVTNKDEMGEDFSIVIDRINKDSILLKKVKLAIGKNQLNERDVKRFIATYLRSLNKFDTPFDKFMQGDIAALTSEQIQGFNLFMGKAKCGTCHFMPLFNGTLPPLFDKIESEILGVPNRINPSEVDNDLGLYKIHGIDFQKYAFKTPSVRNLNKSAPYMHNGIFKNLDEVINFYNHGGGSGLGIELEYQTLPSDSLFLSTNEQKSIKSFLEIL